MPVTTSLPPTAPRRTPLLVLVALVAGLLGAVAAAGPASAHLPTYVVAGEVQGAGADAQWGLMDGYPNGGFHRDLRRLLADTTRFGPNGTVKATFSIRSNPVDNLGGTGALDGVDVFFLSAHTSPLTGAEIANLQAFVARGGALVVNSNGPGFFDDTAWLGFTLTARVVFGDQPGDTTHRSPKPSAVTATGHPIAAGPFGTVSTFDNWHSVTAFGSMPAGATEIARVTSLTGPNGDAAGNATITGPTFAVIPAGGRGTGSGPIVATSDVDTFSNAYVSMPTNLPGDAGNTLFGANNTLTPNGKLAANTFAWIAAQKAVLSPTDGYVGLAAPVRILDTRDGTGGTTGPFADGEIRSVTVTQAGLGIPAGATSVMVNITAVDPSATGYLTAYPAPGAPPTVSSVNFTAGTTVANAAFVRVGGAGRISLYNSAGSTHVLVDIVGYAVANGAHLVTQNPARIKDTRSGLGGARTAGPGETQSLLVAGVAGGPPAGATTVVLNVTAVNATALTYVTAWPADTGQPSTSNINARPGVPVPNLVLVRVPSSGPSAGRINLFNSAGSTDLLVDVLGWFVDAGSTGHAQSIFPSRVLDTRQNATPLTPGEVRRVDVQQSGATSVVLNVTAVEPTATGYLTVFPDGAGRPDASNVNFLAGQTSPNLVVVKVGPGGFVDVYNAAGTTQLLVDVVGAFV